MTRKKSDHAKGKSVACKPSALYPGGNRKTAQHVTGVSTEWIEAGGRLIGELQTGYSNDLSSELCETQVVGRETSAEHNAIRSSAGVIDDTDGEHRKRKRGIGKRASRRLDVDTFESDMKRENNGKSTVDREGEDKYDFSENEKNSDADCRQNGLDGSEDLFRPTVTDDGDRVLEVQCGDNQALLYLAKLCQGSKGTCIRWRDQWLTPNQFQKASGRQTAKDWKRSIRHHGKSMKLLLNKGFISIHSLVCACIQCHDQPLYKRRQQRRTEKQINKSQSTQPIDVTAVKGDMLDTSAAKDGCSDDDGAASDSTIEMVEYVRKGEISANCAAGAILARDKIDDRSEKQPIDDGREGLVLKINEKKKIKKLRTDSVKMSKLEDEVAGLNNPVSNKCDRKRRKKKKKLRTQSLSESSDVRDVNGREQTQTDRVEIGKNSASNCEQDDPKRKDERKQTVQPQPLGANIVAVEECVRVNEKGDNGIGDRVDDFAIDKDSNTCDATVAGGVAVDAVSTSGRGQDAGMNSRDKAGVAGTEITTVGKVSIGDDLVEQRAKCVDKIEQHVVAPAATDTEGDQRESRLGCIINRLNKELRKLDTTKDPRTPGSISALTEKPDEIHAVFAREEEPEIPEHPHVATNSGEDVSENRECYQVQAETENSQSHGEMPGERPPIDIMADNLVAKKLRETVNSKSSRDVTDVTSALEPSLESDHVQTGKTQGGRKKVTAEVRPYGFLVNEPSENNAGDSGESMEIKIPNTPADKEDNAASVSRAALTASDAPKQASSRITEHTPQLASTAHISKNHSNVKHTKGSRDDSQSNKFAAVSRSTNKQTVATVAPRVTVTTKSNVASHTPLATVTSSSTTLSNFMTSRSSSPTPRDAALSHYPFNVGFPFPYAMPFAFPGWLPMSQDPNDLQRTAAASPYTTNPFTDQSYMRGYLPMTSPYCYNPYLTNQLLTSYAGYVAPSGLSKDDNKTRGNAQPWSQKLSGGIQSNPKSIGKKRSHKEAGLDLSNKSSKDNVPLNLSVPKMGQPGRPEKTRSRSGQLSGQNLVKKVKTYKDTIDPFHALQNKTSETANRTASRHSDTLPAGPANGADNQKGPFRKETENDGVLNKDNDSCHRANKNELGHKQSFSIDSTNKEIALKKSKNCACKCRQKGTKYPNIWKWDVEQVCSFLGALNGCSHYAEVFRHHQVDGMVLPLLTVDQLMKSLQMTLRPAVLLVETVSKLLDAYSRDLCDVCRSQRLVV